MLIILIDVFGWNEECEDTSGIIDVAYNISYTARHRLLQLTDVDVDNHTMSFADT